jgi:hypothetical protein
MIRYGTVISFSVLNFNKDTYVKGHKNSVDKINFKIFFTSFIINQSGIINLQRYRSINQCFKQTNRYGILISKSILRYLFGVKWRRSQGCWIRLSGSTGDLFSHLPLLPEQAHEGLCEETLSPLKTKNFFFKIAVPNFNQDPKI